MQEGDLAKKLLSFLFVANLAFFFLHLLLLATTTARAALLN
jgi:hypothetical protein